MPRFDVEWDNYDALLDPSASTATMSSLRLITRSCEGATPIRQPLLTIERDPEMLYKAVENAVFASTMAAYNGRVGYMLNGIITPVRPHDLTPRQPTYEYLWLHEPDSTDNKILTAFGNKGWRFRQTIRNDNPLSGPNIMLLLERRK